MPQPCFAPTGQRHHSVRWVLQPGLPREVPGPAPGSGGPPGGRGMAVPCMRLQGVPRVQVMAYNTATPHHDVSYILLEQMMDCNIVIKRMVILFASTLKLPVQFDTVHALTTLLMPLAMPLFPTPHLLAFSPAINTQMQQVESHFVVCLDRAPTHTCAAGRHS